MGAIAKDDPAKTVPFRFVLPVFAGDFVHGARLHWPQRRCYCEGHLKEQLPVVELGDATVSQTKVSVCAFMPGFSDTAAPRVWAGA